ncbi:hypothetical protein M513_07024 [Trichuris suis]|uniref:ribose-5-phosphate isomerase n=1 Tax=Trichuris suis TaxID=68888 RepID=A0A085M496_9BILA|nr:hypothetical protein M513_07024 [Trichuris suis]
MILPMICVLSNLGGRRLLRIFFASAFKFRMASTDGKQRLEDAKKLAAYECVKQHVESGQVIGVGSGSTAVYVINCLADFYEKGKLRDIVCIPTSYQARCTIIQHKLPLGDLDCYPFLDLCIDGADEVDIELNCIKGGGGCQSQEKLVMSCAKYFYVVADHRKKSNRLGDRWKYVPLEVLSRAYVPVKMAIEEAHGGRCELRLGAGKVGPVITDNGNFILDWYMPSSYVAPNGWKTLHEQMKLVPGVVETGLFIGYAQQAYFGMPDGNVVTLNAPNDRKINCLDRSRITL